MCQYFINQTEWWEIPLRLHLIYERNINKSVDASKLIGHCCNRTEPNGIQTYIKANVKITNSTFLHEVSPEKTKYWMNLVSILRCKNLTGPIIFCTIHCDVSTYTEGGTRDLCEHIFSIVICWHISVLFCWSFSELRVSRITTQQHNVRT